MLKPGGAIIISVPGPINKTDGARVTKEVHDRCLHCALSECASSLTVLAKVNSSIVRKVLCLMSNFGLDLLHTFRMHARHASQTRPCVKSLTFVHMLT